MPTFLHPTKPLFPCFNDSSSNSEHRRQQLARKSDIKDCWKKLKVEIHSLTLRDLMKEKLQWEENVFEARPSYEQRVREARSVVDLSMGSLSEYRALRSSANLESRRSSLVFRDFWDQFSCQHLNSMSMYEAGRQMRAILLSKHWRHYDRLKVVTFCCINAVSPHTLMEFAILSGSLKDDSALMDLWATLVTVYLAAMDSRAGRFWYGLCLEKRKLLYMNGEPVQN